MSTAVRPAEKVEADSKQQSWELQVPEKSLTDLALACAVGIFAVFCVRPFFNYTALGSDEGIAFQGAVRILRGELPYRDFFSFYTPGCYYLYAAVFSLFGASLQAARTLLTVYAALFSFLNYLLARRACSRLQSFLAACLLGLICLPSRFENLHSWDSTIAALLAFYCAVWLLQTRAAPWAFFSGFFTGCAAMMEQTRGAGMIVGFTLAGLALYRLDRERWNLRTFYPAVLGSAIPVLAFLAYFAGHHAVGPMFAGWFWPLQHYTVVNKLPYGYMFWSQTHIFGSTSVIVQSVFAVALSATFLVSFFPIALLALGIFVASRIFLAKQAAKPLFTFVLLLGAVLMGNLLAACATGRPDYLRIVYSAPLFFFAIPLLLDERLIRLPSLAKLRPVLALYIVVSFTECGFLMASRPTLATQNIQTRRGMVQTDVDEVLPYVLSHVAAGDKVLIYPYGATYSFLSATFSPSRYDFLQVGMHTPSQFEEARRELQVDKTPVVIFDLTFLSLVPDVWPSTPAELLAHDPTGDFIHANYRNCKVLESRGRPFAYMVRKDLACPDK